jgi:drug/metabolite transporter (DMT)-like permease
MDLDLSDDRMTTLLALAAALGWAAGDYMSGRTGRVIGSITLTFYMQIWGFILILPLAIIVGGDPSVSDLLIGLGAGILNAFSFVTLIEGMRRSRMGAVLPLSAVSSALLPVVVGVAFGDVLSWLAVAGIISAITGAALASSDEETEKDVTKKRWTRSFDSSALIFGVSSGLGFGIMFSAVSFTSDDAGLWPLIAMRGAMPVMYLLARIKRAPVAPTRERITRSFTASSVAVLAMMCFYLASRRGPLSIVAAIAATAPAGTVVIAHWLGHERTTAVQMTGVVAAIAGVVILTTQ